MTNPELHGAQAAADSKRRILKVRLRQDQVIRLHELRILKGTSIAALLEGILHDYFERHVSDLPSMSHGRTLATLPLELEDDEETA